MREGVLFVPCPSRLCRRFFNLFRVGFARLWQAYAKLLGPDLQQDEIYVRSTDYTRTLEVRTCFSFLLFWVVVLLQSVIKPVLLSFDQSRLWR